MKNNRVLRSPLLFIGVAMVLFFIILSALSNSGGYTEKSISEVVALINSSEPLKEVILTDGEQTIKIETASNPPAKIRSVWVASQSDALVQRLNERVAQKTLTSWKGENPQPSIWSTLLFSVVPFIIIIAIFFFMLNNMQGGANRGFGFGKSKAKLSSKDTPKTTFADVAGCDEAVEELHEIREFLAEPGKFQAIGAKIPKGVLLYGPPGTGKTLLARAVAGEAGVPFFSISGSDFVELYVGVGASRVRDLFSQAKEAAPAIIFIDEIDAVGRHRGAGMGGGHDEREQTLNQLLVEMDGFEMNSGVVLIAATNRPDVLDPALLRPGRFDRQIPVEAPDIKGRYQILRIHGTNKPLAPDADLESVAKRTPGFTGADLANVLNEAALLSARHNQQFIGKLQLDEAIDRVIAGPQKRSRVMDEQELLITAYHEGGHALVAAAMPRTDPVQKVTILPRGRALGYTMVMPDADKYSTTRGELLDELAYMLGGRAAEELVFHDPTTGASSDIEKATKVARAMVTQYGMAESVGAVRIGTGDQDPFLGRDYGHQHDYSEATAAKVDAEVAALIANAHQEAFDCLTENREVLDELVRQLFEHETLDKEQVAKVFEALKPWPKRPAWTGSKTRIPSDIPPVNPPVPKRPESLAASVPAAVPNPPAQLPPGMPVGALPPGYFPPNSGQPYPQLQYPLQTPYPPGAYPPQGAGQPPFPPPGFGYGVPVDANIPGQYPPPSAPFAAAPVPDQSGDAGEQTPPKYALESPFAPPSDFVPDDAVPKHLSEEPQDSE